MLNSENSPKGLRWYSWDYCRDLWKINSYGHQDIYIVQAFFAYEKKYSNPNFLWIIET